MTSKIFGKATALILFIIIVFLALVLCGNIVVSAEENENNGIPIYEDSYYKNEFKFFLENVESIDIDISSIHNKILYDYKENPAFILTYAKENGYMISNRTTATAYEKVAVGNSPYDTIGKKKGYYLGLGHYYTFDSGNIVSIYSGAIIEEEEGNFYQSDIEEIMSADIEENGEKNFFARTSNADRINNSKYISENGRKYFEQDWKTKGYYHMGDGKYDFLLPLNEKDSCAIVACIQLMQYLDRSYNIDTTSAFIKANENNIVYDYTHKDFNKKCLTQVMHDELDRITLSGAFGENYIVNIIAGMKKFFEKYQPRKYVYRPASFYPPDGKYVPAENAYFDFNYNVSYDNMAGQIDKGELAIGLTTIGNGYYQNNGTWEKHSVARHTMLVYGYCTTNKGTLQDFITHSGWRSAGTQKMYVYKLNFMSNLTYTYHR